METNQRFIFKELLSKTLEKYSLFTPSCESRVKAGENVMRLTVPAGPLTSGVMYDYLRLELDEAAAPPRTNR
jgi:hypothetical protein